MNRCSNLKFSGLTELEGHMNRRCPICRSPAPEAVRTGFDSLVLACCSEDCRHMFVADPAAGQGICQRARTPEEIRAEQVSNLEQYGRRNERLVMEFRLRGFLGQNARVLDFGAGFGGVSFALKQQLPGVRLFAVEPSDLQRALLRAQGINAVDSIEDLSHLTFDLVIMLEVIEHLQDPCSTLRLVNSMLSREGALFITTPLGMLADGSLGSGFETPSHLHFFSEKSLALCLAASGFRRPRYEYMPSLYPHHQRVDEWLKLLPEKGRVHLSAFVEPDLLRGDSHGI